MADVYEDLVSGNPVVLPVITEDTLYTPAITGFGTVTTQGIYWRRVGSKLHISGRFVSGTPTATTASIPFPPGLTAAVQGYTNLYMVGKWSDSNPNGSQVKQGVLQVTNGGTAITFGVDDTTSAATAPTVQNGNNIQVTSGMTVYIDGEAIIPIAEWAGSANVAYGAGLATSVKSGLVSYEDKGTVTLTASGAFTGSFVATYSRVGKSVTLNLPRISATTTAAAFITLTGLPASLTPAVDVLTPWMVQNSGTIQLSPGRLDVLSSNSQIRIDNTLQAGTFNNAALGGGFKASVSYVVA